MKRRPPVVLACTPSDQPTTVEFAMIIIREFPAWLAHRNGIMVLPTLPEADQ